MTSSRSPKRQQEQLDAMIKKNDHLSHATAKLKPAGRNNNNRHGNKNNKRSRDDKED